jgi:alanine dehydrogenase
LIVKVKEPQPEERVRLRKGQTLFAYLHLAADRAQAEELMDSGATCIAFETVTDEHGRLPLLAPMSEVAGRLSVQAGAAFLEKARGGAGVLLGGVPGAPRGRVTIIGGGVAGTNAAKIAQGMGAEVTILDKSVNRLRQLDDMFGSRVETVYATQAAVEEEAQRADLLIGSVLVPGAAAPKLIRRDTIRHMRPGSVAVDIAIDQGGCFETSHPTTHDEPTFMEEGVVHYCVANMPGAVPRTSTNALMAAILPGALALVKKGTQAALRDDPNLAAGLNVHDGAITHRAVADALDLPFAAYAV